MVQLKVNNQYTVKLETVYLEDIFSIFQFQNFLLIVKFY